MDREFDWTTRIVRYLPHRVRAHIPEIACALLILTAGMLGWLAWEYRRSVDLVSHTVNVEKSIFEVLLTVKDAESATSGYQLTGNDNFLKQHQSAKSRMDAVVDRLQLLTADNQQQQATIIDLRAAIKERLTRLSAIVEVRRSTSSPTLPASFDPPIGFQQSERIGDLIATMTDVEHRLFTSHVASAKTAAALAVGGVLLNIILIGAAMWSWVRSTRREARDLILSIADREKNETQIRQMHKMEAVGQLTGGLAHDLNNMLAVIISGISLTQKRMDAGKTDVRKFLDAAMDGATRAATLTNRLMGFARQLPLAPQSIDANKLVGGMSDMIQRTLGETIRT